MLVKSGLKCSLFFQTNVANLRNHVTMLTRQISVCREVFKTQKKVNRA